MMEVRKMGWQDFLNEKNQECLRKSKEDGLYTGDYVESEMRQTPVGPRPIQYAIHCMRCGKLIADRRGTPFSSGMIHNILTEEDELKAFPEMRKVQIKLKNVRDGAKIMTCPDCVEPILTHEADERLLFVFVAGHLIFFDQCRYDPKFIAEQVRELESYEVDN